MLTDTGKQAKYNPEVWGGLECTINRVGDRFFDQLEYAGFYQHPTVSSIADLGIKKLRFPVLWEKHQPVKGQPIVWKWTERQLLFFKEKGIDVIAGLVHHGSGPAFTGLLDEQFPYLLADYARQVAEQFPWLQYFTPVNEPLTTARFSGLYKLWYPHDNNDRSFIIMLLNQLKGIVLSMQEIRKINPHAKLVQTEDLGKTYSTTMLKYQAKFENVRRWLTYDFLTGRVDEKHKLWKYFKRIDIPDESVLFFKENKCPPDIFGFNHYVTSERFLDEKKHLYPRHTHGGNRRHSYADVEAVRIELDEEIGIKVLLREAWQRYKSPMAITEVHLHCHREEQLRWFKYVWKSCKELINSGIDIKGVTAWAMMGSWGWNRLLTAPKGDYEPGVFDMRGGSPRPTALTNYIKTINSSNDCSHHLAETDGWWQREGRYLNEPILSKSQKGIDSISKFKPVLIIGKNGTLGRAFARVCDLRALSYKLLSRGDCDIANQNSIEKAIDLYKPWAIINAAGFVRVDDAEREIEKCYRENLEGPFNLASLCTKHGIKLITFSSDLVFDGERGHPYTESDSTSPLNIYGKSKAECERMVLQANQSALVIRTSAFFGTWDQYNFLHWVEISLNNKQLVPVANDVYVSPTYVPDLVNTSLDLMIDDESGIWHLANEGAVTWSDLAYETARQFGGDPTLVQAMPLAELDLPATRPRYSVLGSEKGILMPSLESALRRYFSEKKQFVEW
jgi:dTDP-4-dehydrorhamnose reductase